MSTPVQATAAAPIVRRARPLTRIDRGAVLRFGLGAIAAGVAIVAQSFLERKLYLVDAGIVMVVCGLVFARAARGTLAPPPDAPAVPLPAPLVERRPHLGLVLAGGALLLGLASVAAFILDWPNTAWGLYAASMPVGLAGAYALDARPSLRNVVRRNVPAIVVVAFLTVVALVLRL